MTQTNTNTPARLLSRLERCEVNGSLAPDCRRVLRDERFALAAACRSGDGARIRSAVAEAIRVAEMWGVSL